jgi:hypothetical protein
MSRVTDQVSFFFKKKRDIPIRIRLMHVGYTLAIYGVHMFIFINLYTKGLFACPPTAPHRA